MITPTKSKRGSQLQTSAVKEQTALNSASFSRSLDSRYRVVRKCPEVSKSGKSRYGFYDTVSRIEIERSLLPCKRP
ncbi:hypothetical protein TNCT_17311 [Trichonephila clavata]|uniref:Uncharacterized protein n=1 Tax=Trichonephila clavata TaxID=2740835 RepID=A0A8X6FXH2_TRICU|nr:hypothetical protein TNCT_17311 [Trichonephila clavata]